MSLVLGGGTGDRGLGPGGFLHKYRLGRVHAQGGMGTVWDAWDPVLQRRVAIKTLVPERIGSREMQQGLLREATTLVRMEHVNIVRLFDAGFYADQIPYIVMEWVDGRNLRELLTIFGMFDAQSAISIGVQIADGLRVAHDVGFIHRDLKPENVLMTRTGIIKIADFGIAFRQGTGTDQFANMGTPHFMAPEQVLGQRVTPKADIYTLGLLVYQMLSGYYAFSYDTDDLPTSTEARACHVNAEPISLVERDDIYYVEAWEVIGPMLAKNPEDRPCAVEAATRLNALIPIYDDRSVVPRFPLPKRPSVPTRMRVFPVQAALEHLELQERVSLDLIAAVTEESVANSERRASLPFEQGPPLTTAATVPVPSFGVAPPESSPPESSSRRAVRGDASPTPGPVTRIQRRDQTRRDPLLLRPNGRLAAPDPVFTPTRHTLPLMLPAPAPEPAFTPTRHTLPLMLPAPAPSAAARNKVPASSWQWPPAADARSVRALSPTTTTQPAAVRAPAGNRVRSALSTALGVVAGSAATALIMSLVLAPSAPVKALRAWPNLPDQLDMPPEEQATPEGEGALPPQPAPPPIPPKPAKAATAPRSSPTNDRLFFDDDAPAPTTAKPKKVVPPDPF